MSFFELQEADEWFLKYVEPLQKTLKMDDWRYELSWRAPENPENLMECVTNLSRKVASIRKHKDEVLTREEFRHAILHEMIHPILEPIRAEHKLQMKVLKTDRADEYFERITNEVEKVVDHLTKVIYDMELALQQASVAERT